MARLVELARVTGRVPLWPAPSHRTSQVLVAVTGYRPPGACALVRV
ncbi:hypothetical protein OG906_38270 (plasmid) [Streptomyces sp. NBC_01426]|nr:hypothetical protein [Streptomyces sp. NBC_01426]